MPTGNSLYQGKPGRLAREKKEFCTLVEQLKSLAAERGYTKKQIASELGVSHGSSTMVDRLHADRQTRNASKTEEVFGR
jgi:hypothetical protein